MLYKIGFTNSYYISFWQTLSKQCHTWNKSTLNGFRVSLNKRDGLADIIIFRFKSTNIFSGPKKNDFSVLREQNIEFPHIYSLVTPLTQMPSKHGWQMSAVWLVGVRKRRVYLHITVGAGLSTGQRSALGHGDAALAHLTAEVVPLVPHWALQGTVFSQVGAGVIWKSWGRGRVITPQQFIKGMSCYGGCLREHSQPTCRN